MSRAIIEEAADVVTVAGKKEDLEELTRSLESTAGKLVIFVGGILVGKQANR